MLKRESALIDAIVTEELAASDDPEAAAMCAAIGRRVGLESTEVMAALANAGVDALIDEPVDRPRQNHNFELRVDNADQARRGAEALRALGYVPWEPVSGGPWQVRRRLRSVLTLARSDAFTLVVRFRWDARATRLPAAIQPNELDFDIVDLPSWAWPLYFGVRPVRLVLERLGLRSGRTASLGPHLTTPEALIDPLLRLASVTADDVFVDLGCGDARLPVAAAELFGCRAFGVESNPDLVALARERAAASSAAELVEIVEGDAASFDVSSATVVFVFLPADVTGSIVDSALSRLPAGARVVSHEQRPILDVTPPDQIVPMLSPQGATVAHLWLVSGPDS